MIEIDHRKLPVYFGTSSGDNMFDMSVSESLIQHKIHSMGENLLVIPILHAELLWEREDI